MTSPEKVPDSGSVARGGVKRRAVAALTSTTEPSRVKIVPVGCCTRA
ncbi:MAG: hypothetical protein KIT68_05895 [Phycisphaeraceae bacterium]|nr:hypothetical protein [Phycisphaeraceae bacterium]